MRARDRVLYTKLAQCAPFKVRLAVARDRLVRSFDKDNAANAEEAANLYVDTAERVFGPREHLDPYYCSSTQQIKPGPLDQQQPDVDISSITFDEAGLLLLADIVFAPRAGRLGYTALDWEALTDTEVRRSYGGGGAGGVIEPAMTVCDNARVHMSPPG